MTHYPMTSSEQGKILIFTLFLIPAIFFGVGVIPAIFLIYGVFMMRKNEDFAYIETSVKYMKIYLYLATIALWVFAGILYIDECDSEFNVCMKNGDLEEPFIAVLLSFLPVFYFAILNSLFLSPLRAHRDWVSINGIFSSKKKSAAGLMSEPDIIKGEKMKQFSVADELLKWAKLKEDGHITEQEFNEARSKLLKRD
jgi:fatty acid desaturase